MRITDWLCSRGVPYDDESFYSSVEEEVANSAPLVSVRLAGTSFDKKRLGVISQISSRDKTPHPVLFVHATISVDPNAVLAVWCRPGWLVPLFFLPKGTLDGKQVGLMEVIRTWYPHTDSPDRDNELWFSNLATVPPLSNLEGKREVTWLRGLVGVAPLIRKDCLWVTMGTSRYEGDELSRQISILKDFYRDTPNKRLLWDDEDLLRIFEREIFEAELGGS